MSGMLSGDHPLGLLAGADLSSTGLHRFVVEAADARTVTLCGAGVQPTGVLCNSPASGEVADVTCASGRFVRLEVDGTSAIAKGDYLKSAANGIGVKAGTDKDLYGAKAHEVSTASGDIIWVELMSGSVSV